VALSSHAIIAKIYIYISFGFRTGISFTAIFDGTNDIIAHLIKQKMFSLHDNVMSIKSDDAFTQEVKCTTKKPIMDITGAGSSFVAHVYHIMLILCSLSGFLPVAQTLHLNIYGYGSIPSRYIFYCFNVGK